MAVHIASYSTPLDAELARGLLEASDIPAEFDGDVLASATPWAQGTFSVRLYVAEEHAEEAQRLLENHERGLAAERRRAEGLDEKATRAYRLAIVGWMLLPVITQAISAFTLLRLPYPKLSPQAKRHYRIGMSFNAIVLGSALFLIVRAFLK